MDNATRQKNQARISQLRLIFNEEYPATKINRITDIVKGDNSHYICDNESVLQYVQACQAFNRLVLKTGVIAGSSISSGGIALIPGSLALLYKGSDLAEIPKIYHLIKTIGSNKTFQIGWTKTRGNRILGANICGQWDELQRLLAFEGEPPEV